MNYRYNASTLSRSEIILLFVAGLLLCGLSIVKASRQGPTYDEAYTYFNYARSLSDAFRIDLANNHPLNSFLVAIAAKAKPFDTLTMRIPSLAFLPVYLAAAVALAWQLPESARYVVFALHVFNPYLLEFFTLARGYGMCAALIAAALASMPRRDGL